jgi:hypothetical protein
MTEAEWAWKFDWNPDGGFATVAVAGGAIVGNYAGCGASFLVGGRPALVYFVGDVATDPSARSLGGRHGAYRTMADAFYAALVGRVPFCLGFPNDRALTISHRLVGTQTVVPIRHVRVDAARFGRAPAGVESSDSVDEAFDSLWEDASRAIAFGAVRDRTRVNWRFHARPNRYYRMVWWKERGSMRGWAALSVSGERALVADFLGRDPAGADLPALFAAAASEAGRMGARELVFWETPGGPARDLIAQLPGERESAGYSMIARVLEPDRFDGLAGGLHLVPSLYDLV